jgi:hypothetical protein
VELFTVGNAKVQSGVSGLKILPGFTEHFENMHEY